MRKKAALIIGTVLILASVVLLASTLWDYKKAEHTYDELEETYVTVPEEAEESENWWYEDVNIELTELAAENQDVIGWIRFDHIDVLSYPVMYSGDDETYLRTDIYGNNSTSGSIFMEGACNPDFEDYHTILYGHNMKNLSMFGSLKQYKTEGFYKENQYFTVYTADMAYRYQIFSYRDVLETDEVYTVGFGPDEKYEEFISEMLRKSYEDTGVEVTKEDKVLTLSTCSTRGHRFVVHAVRVDEHAY